MDKEKCFYCNKQWNYMYDNLYDKYTQNICCDCIATFCVSCYEHIRKNEYNICKNCRKILKKHSRYNGLCHYCNSYFYNHYCMIPIKNKYMNINVL